MRARDRTSRWVCTKFSAFATRSGASGREMGRLQVVRGRVHRLPIVQSRARVLRGRGVSAWARHEANDRHQRSDEGREDHRDRMIEQRRRKTRGVTDDHSEELPFATKVIGRASQPAATPEGTPDGRRDAIDDHSAVERDAHPDDKRAQDDVLMARLAPVGARTIGGRRRCCYRRSRPGRDARCALCSLRTRRTHSTASVFPRRVGPRRSRLTLRRRRGGPGGDTARAPPARTWRFP